jgi:hypothetical protein
MAVETRWLLEKRILYQRFSGELTVDDFRQSIEEAGAFIAQGVPLVHAIADLLQVRKWPSLFEMNRIARRSPYPGIGWTVVVVSNPALRFVASILIQFTMANYKMAASVDEALRFLAERDNTLDMSQQANSD